MRVPLKNRLQAAPESQEEAGTIPSQQWHTGEPYPFVEPRTLIPGRSSSSNCMHHMDRNGLPLMFDT
ncbi:hypothetical protein AHAS_Ahas05G0011400 [Arachis hypogaea]